MLTIDAQGKRVLLIGDLHFPYAHIDSIPFLKAVRSRYFNDDDIFISMGDELDHKAISFHEKCGEALSPDYELAKGIEYLKELEKIFPVLKILESNHGSLIFRRMKSHQLPIRYLKSLNEVLEVGPGFEWCDDILLKTKIGDVYLTHGKTSGNGKLCKEMGCSTAQGHYHGKFQVVWHKSIMKESFDCFTGCLVDIDSLAMVYGKNHLPKPILGVVFLSACGYPNLLKMGLNEKGRWDGNLP